MPNFSLPMPDVPTNKVKTGGVNMGGVKLKLAQMHNARLETLGNLIHQVKISVGQQTITQPIPQLPAGVKPGQTYQVSISTNKSGKTVIEFFPEQGKTTSPQTMKVSLSDAQLVSMLSLNKNYKPAADGGVKAQATIVVEGGSVKAQATIVVEGGSVKAQAIIVVEGGSVKAQAQATIVVEGAKAPALKLPGLSNSVILPKGVAGLLKDSKTVEVSISAKSNKIELLLTLPGKTSANTKFKVPLPAGAITTIVKQQLSKSADSPVQIETKGNAPSKLVLSNQQKIALPGKVAPDSQVKVFNLNHRQMSIKISPVPVADQTSPKQLATVVLDRPMVTNALKQTMSGSTDKVIPVHSKSAGENTKIQVQTLKLNSEKGVASAKVTVNEQSAGESKVTTDSKVAASQAKTTTINAPLMIADAPQAKPIENYEQQKQVLSKLIDPLIRILLPKKLNWSEGLKSLAMLEKQLPDSKPMPDTEKVPDLKQVLNQLRASIPDQNSLLTEKNISAIVGQLLNFSPTKVMTSPQPTPANAIASALQLLLGSKLVQNEAKVTPQLLQQLTTLLKPMTDKEGKTPKGMKALTGAMAQSEQSSGSLKTLAGITSGIRHQQLDNAEKKFDGNSQINLSVPLKVDDEVKELHISINEEEAQSEKGRKKTSVWQLNLTFDLGELGKLLVNAKLKEGEVNMNLYAEQQRTLSMMNKFSSILEQRLEFHGVKIKNIQSSLGKINNTNGVRQQTSLLQIKV